MTDLQCVERKEKPFYNNSNSIVEDNQKPKGPCDAQ